MASLEHLKVLVADDNAHMRAIVVTVLKSLGVKQIREASDGGAALKVLAEFVADVAIVDLRMQPMDGLTFTRQVRGETDGRNAFLPIVMMTGYADRGRVMEARDAGVTELVVKPVSGRSLIGRLNAVIFQPRPFVRTACYFGPDRRRMTVERPGPERRRAG